MRAAEIRWKQLMRNAYGLRATNAIASPARLLPTEISDHLSPSLQRNFPHPISLEALRVPWLVSLPVTVNSVTGFDSPHTLARLRRKVHAKDGECLLQASARMQL
ncbi:hypothetical protein PCA10_38940 [Metapseudomonas resinovorans NBRC 106553]|uniref:Uncharacterized protein n=1 Tax=Metapseudomonas resinovorans NBRC 106553 TaxID=1245471 RepID=S6AY47_METRE|nr:hypothetical protein PCA10_38940 [Pseudomonas resinovorans NBRC 106553]